MADREKKLNVFGRQVDVVESPIKSANEVFSEYELEDGTKIRIKNVAVSIDRVVGQFLADGRPIYVVSVNPIVDVISSPHSKTGP